VLRITIRPGERGSLEVSVPEMAIKLRALRVVIELGDSVAEATPANGAVRLRTPRGEYYYLRVVVGVRDPLSIEDRPPDIVIRNALYVY
jgi:hypothetical protein